MNALPLPGLEATPGADWLLVITAEQMLKGKGLPLSMNEREGYLFRKMSYVLGREKALVLDAIHHAAYELGVTKAEGPRVVQFTFQKTNQGRHDDPGNLWSRTKAPLDAMVKLGILVDDSDEWLELPRPLQTKGPAKCMFIAISEAPPSAS